MKTRWMRGMMATAVLTTVLMGAGSARAGTVVSAGSGSWEDGATWGGTVPTASDDVFIQAGHTVTMNGLTTRAINSLSITGVLEHAANAGSEAHKIVLNIAGNLTIEAAGKIDVDRRGFAANQGTGKGGSNFGASHGGRGGRYTSGPALATYGSVTAPVTLGSGGPQAGSEGGGAVILNVGGAVTHNGLITARGGPDAASTGGGGSGGSIFITTGTLTGSGTNDVSVPDNVGSTHTGGGGGGRIAIVVTNAANFGSVVNRAYGGDGTFNSVLNQSQGGGGGTIYLKKLGDANGTLMVDNNGKEGRIWYTDLPPATYVFDSIIATNAGMPNVAAGVVIDMSADPLLRCYGGGQLILGGGQLILPPEFVITNATLSQAGTAMHTWTGNVTVTEGSVLTHQANADTASGEMNKLALTIDGNLTVATGAQITAFAKGYDQSNGPLGGGQHWGGGHGGQAGRYSGTIKTALYGSITSPTSIGSGGFSNVGRARGGGAIRLVVSGATTNSGLITADGQDNSGGNNAGGAGAGGSVWLATGTLHGDGTIRADGAEAMGQNNGGGGGGRVSVVLTNGTSFSLQTIHAYGGIGRSSSIDSQTYGGGAGTVYLKTAAQSHGQLILDNNGRMAASATALTRIASNVTGVIVGDVINRGAAKLLIEPSLSLTCYGSWSNAATFTALTDSTVTLAGAGMADFYGSNRFYNLTCQVPGKTLRFNGGSKTLIQPFGGLTWEGESGNHLTVTSLTASAWQLMLEPNAMQSVDFVAAAYSDASLGQTIVAPTSQNNGNNTNWNFASGGTVVWNGSVSTAWETGANWDGAAVPTALDTVIVPDLGATNYPVLSANASVAALTNAAGASLLLNGNNLTVSGPLHIDGTLTAIGTETVTVGGDVNFAGGSFVRALSRLTLAGAGNQSFDGGGNVFSRVIVANGGGVVSFTSGLTAEDLYCTTPGATLEFADGGESYVVVNMLLRGASGDPVTLRSASGSAWNLAVSGWHAVRFVSVEDSDASGGNGIYAADSNNVGSNVNWFFPVWHVWSGASSASWATAGNWTNNAVPGSGNFVWIDGNGANAPVLSSVATIERLVVGPTATTLLTVNTNLTVTGDAVIGPSSTLTHAGPAAAETSRVMLTVGGDMFLADGAKIELTSKGFNTQTGPGTTGGNTAGSYGGQGNPVSGTCYGSIVAPTRWGSGGHSSAGGGAVQLTVAGTAALDGDILANANNGDHYPGSGGSVFITAGELRGRGTLSANGGSGTMTTYGSGGGGRIAVVLTNGTSFGNVTMTAYDGRGLAQGAAGTVYRQTSNEAYGTMIVDNGGEGPHQSTLISSSVQGATVGDVVLSGGGRLHIAADQSLTVHGSWSNAASFSADSGSAVEFAGPAEATVWNNNSWQNLTIATAGKTVSFEAGRTQTVNGTPTFDGSVTLLSTVPGTQWNLTVPIDGENTTQPVGRVSARDSDASAGRTIIPQGGTDLGNNLNWIFPPAGTLFMLR